MAPVEVAASQDPGDGPPERIDPSWLLLQRLDDVRREQDRFHGELAGTRLELRQQAGELRGEIGELRAQVGPQTGELRREIGELRAGTDRRVGELRREIAGLRADVDHKVGELRQDIEKVAAGTNEQFARMQAQFVQAFGRLTGWFVTGLVTLLGAVFASAWLR